MSRFTEVARAKTAENKSLVISKTKNNDYSLAQEITFNDNNKEFKMFVKNAIQTDIEGLKEIKKAIDKALENC